MSCDVHKGKHRPFDDVFHCAIREHAHQIPMAIASLDFGFARNQGLENGFHFFAEAVVVGEIGSDVTDRAAEITLDEIDDLGDGGRETLDAEIMINE